VQPTCQTLPDGSVVNNPAFVAGEGVSYWTYKFLTDCTSATRGISTIGIPICAEIIAANITVEEKIDGCGSFTQIDFELKTDDPVLGTAPEGYQFIKITTADRYDKGVCVAYRISIVGDYPEAVQSIAVKAALVLYTFGCTGCYVVPGCTEAGRLVVNKLCSHTIDENQATLNYSVTVTNVGEEQLDNVIFEDTIFIPTQFTLGTITVSPDTLTVSTSTPGQVVISGNIGSIAPGGVVTITYSIPITNISQPGRYTINNTAMASATGTTDFSTCYTILDAVAFSASKCCTVDGAAGNFRVTVSSVGASPDTTVDITDSMQLPAGVTIQFTSFNGCTVYYAGTTNAVPLNTNLTGPQEFDIFCEDVAVPAGEGVSKNIQFTLVSASVIGTSVITNTLLTVTPSNPDSLIFLGASNLPASASVNVTLSQVCAAPCQA
jgi:uncharacterized repeat protein (TIGR01451 family)